MTDILFLSPTIISGDEDAQPFVADVLVSNGLIARIGAPGSIAISKATEAEAGGNATTRVIDVKGCVLCPGFIDMHAHSDLYLLTHPEHEAKISQGCTTEVLGQDGISYAPVRSPEQLTLIRSQIAGWNGNPSDEECQAMLDKDIAVGIFGWRSVGEYLACLERNGTATNVAYLVPQGNLRLLACGPWKGEASEQEVKDQMELLREAMEQGAVGMSSGLTYTPGMYASNAELACLCRVLAEEYPGAYFAPHHRSYGHRAIESYDEMLKIGESTQCPVHLTHATLNFAENKNKAPLLLSMVDDCIAKGLDVTLDTYPYLPGATTLAALLPSWATAGGPDETLKRLEDEDVRERIRVAVEVEGCDGGHGVPTNWDEIQLGSTQDVSMASYPGRRISEIARSLKKPPHELLFEILQKDRLATSCIMHVGNEENVREIMQHRTHMASSDALLHGKTVHPRAWGTFPRFIGHYSRDVGLIPLPKMIAHLTSRPAKRLSIYPHRGLIAQGSAADIVVFDPQTILDMATFEEPKQRSRGIRFVLVNGQIALDQGRTTGVRGGKTLRYRSF